MYSRILLAIVLFISSNAPAVSSSRTKPTFDVYRFNSVDFITKDTTDSDDFTPFNYTGPVTHITCPKGKCANGYVCVNGYCSDCISTSQCIEENSQQVCKYMISNGGLLPYGLCAHKHLFNAKFTLYDGLSFSIFFVAAAISAGGGVGGGGIFVPVLILVARFTTKEAIPLSNTLVAGASVANLIQNFGKKRPRNPTKTLIDFSTALLIEPLTLLGTTIGVFLHQIFPGYLIILLLAIAMGATTIKTTTKGIQTYKKERAADEERFLLASSLSLNDESIKAQYPWADIVQLILILAVSTTISTLRGGDGSPSLIGILQCSPLYWIFTVVLFPLIILFSIFAGWRMLKRNQIELDKGIKMPGDILWSAKKILLVGIFSLFAGVLASLLGVGGGLIKAPVLLELGLSPDVTAATSSYMILFTSLSSSIQYLLLGRLILDYGLIFFFIGIVASFFGQTALNWMVSKYNRKSYIIFVIAAVIGLSTLLLMVTEVLSFIGSGGSDKFTWICDSAPS
eukprot:TRINITY_DN5880_c0_g1_i1.p1 TRINITY_DN5880_c0_g1~~TRINITY_DN5880_c0_g1_i1.p1  ORF type:complete len:511 (-),score=57.15 TRINITY_DN5880_c0_g1_i1:88-1620(-)